MNKIIQNKKGKLIVFDGIDGCGKSSILKSALNVLSSRGKRVFDLVDYCKKNKELPSPEEFSDYDIIFLNEPSYSWVGLAIRKEITKNSDRLYSSFATADAFSLDRLIIYKRVIVPALEKGIDIFSDRSVTTSIVYQPIQINPKNPLEKPINIEKVLSLEGNKFALENRPDLLVIAKISVSEVIKRLKGDRFNIKNDDSIFENADFLQKASDRFMSGWFCNLFREKGSRVEYLATDENLSSETEEFIRLYDSLNK
jgi:thymidylate kinase